MKKYFLFILSLMIILILASAPVYAWGNNTYNKRRLVTCNISTGSITTDIPFLLNLSYYTGAQADFTDTFLMTTNELTPLDFIIEGGTNSSNAYIWINGTEGLNYSFHYYYDNATAISDLSNGKKVFTFYDNLDDSNLNATLFNTLGTGVTETTGIIYVNSGGDNGINSTSQFAMGSYAVRMRIQQNGTAPSGNYQGFGVTSFSDYLLVSAGSGTSIFYHSGTSTAIDDNVGNWNVYDIFGNGSSYCGFKRDYGLETRVYTSNCPATPNLDLLVYRYNNSGDWYAVRKITAGYRYEDEVTCSVGSEENISPPDVSILNNDFDVAVYELSDTDFSITFRYNETIVNNITAFFNYNATDYNATDITSVSGGGETNITYNYTNLTTPFSIWDNNTDIIHFWNYTIQYTNTTNTTTNTSNVQAILYASYLDNVGVEPVYILETMPFWLYANYTNLTTPPTSDITLQYNDTNYSSSSETLNALSVNADTNVTINAWLNVSYLGEFRISNISSEQKIFNFNITNCSTGYVALNFSTFDEEYKTSIHANLTISLNATYNNLDFETAFIFNNQTTFEICISPNWSEMYEVDAWIIYNGTSNTENYCQREYFIINGNLTNTTQNIELYTLESDDCLGFTGTVVNEFDIKQEDTIIEALRWFNGESSYKTVSMSKTDVNGEGFMYLDFYNTHYKFLLKQDGTVVLETTPALITSNTRQFEILGESDITYYEIGNTLSYSTSFNASGTNYYRITVTSNSNLMTGVNLTIYEGGLLGETIYCSNYSSGTSSISLVCPTALIVGNSYIIKAIVYTTIQDYTVISEIFQVGDKTNYFGTDGAIFAGLITMTALLSGAYISPVGALVFGTLALFGSIVLGLAPITFGSLIAIIIIMGVILIL